ncbi:MAG: endonuclease/exonuclease/phosphatase family protein [Clostridia bacterium]|nr:endonuclease/exonuclease/phosphatase family protein [Clostridia bacterium]
MKNHKGLKIFFMIIGIILALVIAFTGCFLIFASATTLKVKDSEAIEVTGGADVKPGKGTQLKILTWNIGYGALDERQDCYWDGGKGVDGESKEIVQENVAVIKNKINEINPDVFFIQEIDTSSKRSYRINELDSFQEMYKEDTFASTYAKNFKAGFVPLPLYNPTGKVEAGIAIFSRYQVSEAERIQLPIPFSWPVSLLNLKRCLLINRLPVEGSDKELVLINLHLEAYDDGEGKAKQLAMLMDIMQQEFDKGNYVIAGGDFNQTFSTVNYQKYPKMNDWVCPVIDAENYPSFSFVMDDTTPTCRSLYKPYYNSDKANHQYYMIDGFIVSGNVSIDQLETLDYGFKNTDHNPVSMTVTLK